MSKKKVRFAGIDVSKNELHVAVVGHPTPATFPNTPTGHKRLVAFLTKRGASAHVVLESTGPYGLDAALFLHHARRIVVFYLNPVQAKAFATSQFRRAKTDRADARSLAEMAAVAKALKLAVWQPPSSQALSLRALTRRYRAVVEEQTREKNRFAANQATQTTPAFLQEDLAAHIAYLETRKAALLAAALEEVQKERKLKGYYEQLMAVPGIAQVTALEFLGEYACLPTDLTARQLVAQAGLDPRTKQSGKTDAPRRISKMGSKHLRGVMCRAAVNVARWCDPLKAHFLRLTEEKKKAKMVAYVAIARKLLHILHALLRSGEAFDPQRIGQTSPRQAA